MSISAKSQRIWCLHSCRLLKSRTRLSPSWPCKPPLRSFRWGYSRRPTGQPSNTKLVQFLGMVTSKKRSEPDFHLSMNVLRGCQYRILLLASQAVLPASCGGLHGHDGLSRVRDFNRRHECKHHILCDLALILIGSRKDDVVVPRLAQAEINV